MPFDLAQLSLVFDIGVAQLSKHLIRDKTFSPLQVELRRRWGSWVNRMEALVQEHLRPNQLMPEQDLGLPPTKTTMKGKK